MATRRTGRYVLVGAAILVAVLVGLAWWLTRSESGVERSGRFAIDRLRSSINGELEVGRVSSGGLLRGATLHDVRLTGPDGRPFIVADSARLAYRLRTLMGGDIAFDRLILHSPRVVVERLPGQEEWNYERILRGDTTAADTVQDDLVLLEDVTIHDGTVIVRQPWEPDGPVEADDTARLILEEVPGGLARTVRFEGLDARLPRIVWDAPGQDTKLIEIGELATRAYLWETPVEVRAVDGVVTIRDSLISFEAPRVRLPDSELAIVGRLILAEENRYDIEMDGQTVSFSDFQWLHPPLPAEGGGRLRLRIQTREGGAILWLAQDVSLRTGGTEVAGSFGIVTGDTLYFTNVDLDASPLDLELLQRLVPSSLPLEGLLIGTVEVEGPISALDTRGDAILTALGPGSRVRWDGTIGLRPPYETVELDLEVRGIDLDRVARFAPRLRLRGLATGRVRATGSLEHGLGLRGDLALRRGEEQSAVRGSGTLAVGGDRSAFDLRIDAEPVAVELLSEQFPALGELAGTATGPLTVEGSLDSLEVEADLRTEAGGVLFRGTFDVAGEVARYRAQGVLTDFELDRIMRELPSTVVTGQFAVEGEGTTSGTIDAEGALHVLAARVEGVRVNSSTLRGSLAGGLIRLDTLVVATEMGTAHGAGSFGLVEGRKGELAVSLHADRLEPLEPILFAGSDAEPAEDGRPRLAGRVDASAVLEGSVHGWSARGRAVARDIVYDRVSFGEGSTEFVLRPDSSVVRASVDAVRVGDRRLEHGYAMVAWRPAGGRFSATTVAAGREQLEVQGRFRPQPGPPGQADHRSAREVELTRFALNAGDARWAADPVKLVMGSTGVTVDSLVLRRSAGGGRIRLAGSIPWQGPGEPRSRPADMILELDRVGVGELLRVTQTDSTIDGVVSGRVSLAGTALAPSLVGELEARPLHYESAVFDSAATVLAYDERRLRGTFAGWRSGRSVVHGSGSVALDLALAPREERLLDGPLTLRARADSLPAPLLSFLMPGFRGVTGRVDGELSLTGTPRSPELEGELTLAGGSAYFEPLEVRFRTLDLTATMGTRSEVAVDARIATEEGSGRITGTLDMAQPRDPGFDLTVQARELDASGRSDVAVVVSGATRVRGRYTRPVISGDLRILRGEMNLDEIWRQRSIVQLDPSIFRMIDSAGVAFRPPREIPFLENLRLTGTTITADRGFWLRSRELNVEVSGTLETEVDRQAADLRLTGTLQAVGGDYALQLVEGVPARVFDIRGGTIEFVGTPGIDPDLDMVARYRVRRAQGDPIDVVANVTGTLQDPRVGLTSDADLPLSESDLASYILFGRSGAELTQAQTDVVSHGIGLVRPVATGLLSTELQRALIGTGLPIDHVAFTTPEYGLDQLDRYWQHRGLAGVFHNTQLEVGIDAGSDLSLVGSVRIPTDGPTPGEAPSPWRMFGARVEWRFLPSWTTEFYVEDRFARTPSFGLTEIDDRKVWGLSLFRDWGY